MKYKQPIINVTFFLLLITQLVLCFYSVNKGAANTDEFTTALQLRFTSYLLMIDLYNMIDIVVHLFFKDPTLITLRYSKFFFIIISVIIQLIVLYPVIVKRMNWSLSGFFLIGYLFFTASVVTVFNRALHYNDLMDHCSFCCVALLMNILFVEQNFLKLLAITMVYALATFLLAGTKFPLAILAIIFFILTIARFLKIDATAKAAIVFLYISILVAIEYIYINSYYGGWRGFANGYKVIRQIFFNTTFPLYIVDVIAFIALLLLCMLLRKSAYKTYQYLLKYMCKELILIIILVIISFSFLFLVRGFNTNEGFFILYFFVPPVLIILTLYFFSLEYIADNFKGSLNTIFSDRLNYISGLAVLFFAGGLFGSYTLQVINFILHPYAVIFIFVLLALRQKRYVLLQFIAGCTFLMFVSYTLFNPFLFSQLSMFRQRHPVEFKSTHERLYVDYKAESFYKKIEASVGQLDNDNFAVNFDFPNVLYFLGFKPYLITNVVDEQPVSIYKKQLQIIGENIKLNKLPTLLLIAKPINKDFIDCLQNESGVKQDRLITEVENPISNIFKNTKKGNLYIYTLTKINR